MNKEELRMHLMRERYDDKEQLVDLCVLVQIELHQPDADKILQMPDQRFDAICSSLNRIYNKKQKPPKQTFGKRGGTFG